MNFPCLPGLARALAAVGLCALLPCGAAAQDEAGLLPKPAEWSQNDWYNFVESAVQISLGEAYGVAGGRFPAVDLYSALNAMGGAVKPGLTLWLNRKRVDAAAQGDWARHDRYNAFFTCLNHTGAGACAELRRMDRELKARLAAQEAEAPGRRSDDRGNGRCDDISGDWAQSAPPVGSSTWRISRSGSGYYAEESGLGRATGYANFSGRVLSVHWDTPDNQYSGRYTWQLDDACLGGNGQLSFTRKPASDRGPAQVASTVRRR